MLIVTMRKHMRRKHSAAAFENAHPGCMWGILQVLDYHHWRHVKKMLPLRRHGGGRRSEGNIIDIQNDGKIAEHVDAEMNHSIAEEKMTESSPATKSSMKARIKARIAEEVSKRKGQHHRSSTYPTQSQLTRTDSIHHLEPSDQDPLAEFFFSILSPRIAPQGDENSHATCTPDPLPPQASEEPDSSMTKCDVCNTMFTVNHLGHKHTDAEHGKQLAENETLLQEKLDEAKQALLEQKLKYATEHARDAPLYQSKEFLDALDIVNVNKELFLKTLKDQGSPLAHPIRGRRAFNKKIGLTKSGSFPVGGVSDIRTITASGPNETNHKLKQVKSLVREGKSEVDIQANISEKLMPLIDQNRVNQANSETASPGSPLQLSNGTESQVARKRFKGLKQRIKHVIRESRKEKGRITMDAVLHKIPYGRKFSKDAKKEIPDQWKEDRDGKDSPATGYESDHSGPSKSSLHRFRRISSFGDSLDRYCQLYESSFNKESKDQSSERLKLRTEEANAPGVRVPKSLGRILSLPDLNSYYHFRSEDSPDTSGTEPKTHELPENRIQLDTLVESESEENLIEVGQIKPVTGEQVGSTSVANTEMSMSFDDSSKLALGDVVFHQEQEIGSDSKPAAKLAEPAPLSVSDSSLQEDITTPVMFSISEDSDMKATSLENVEELNRYLDIDSHFVQVDTKDKAEFNYVRDVLELSGFSRDELLGTWHSSDQPLDPSVYEEVEGYLPQGHVCSENEEGGYCNHLLLFDIINEVLMDIYERSFSYCPKPLSSLSHIRPMPVGYYVLEEVWANISWYLSSRPELDESLDYVVSRDLAKGDGWMNLQFDTECVGLELEDLIFDDLLEEVICT